MFESMIWQDIVFSVGNFLFAAALLPSIFSKHKPSFWTCSLTATTLTTFVIAFYTLELLTSAFAVGLSSLAWWVLWFQTFPRKPAANLETDK